VVDYVDTWLIAGASDLSNPGDLVRSGTRRRQREPGPRGGGPMRAAVLHGVDEPLTIEYGGNTINIISLIKINIINSYSWPY
jgi:hypothetical protein